MKKNLISFLLLVSFFNLRAQETYEVQVYSSPTTPKNSTIFELHSNISPNGPNNETNFSHPLHETLEITTGISDNFEIGFYLFDRVNDGKYNYMGSHIRPRFTVPTSWNWYFGTSISIESGFVKDPLTNEFDSDFEFRPIFDKTIGKNYFSLNPTIDGSFKTHETTFSPNVKYSYNVNPKYSLGLEYYGSTGNPLKWDNYNLQSHLFYLVTDLYLDPKYEFQFGVGHGTTESSDQWNVKLIVGNRVSWKK
jgi:hypothetical protein